MIEMFYFIQKALSLKRKRTFSTRELGYQGLKCKANVFLTCHLKEAIVAIHNASVFNYDTD